VKSLGRSLVIYEVDVEIARRILELPRGPAVYSLVITRILLRPVLDRRRKLLTTPPAFRSR